MVAENRNGFPGLDREISLGRFWDWTFTAHAAKEVPIRDSRPRTSGLSPGPIRRDLPRAIKFRVSNPPGPPRRNQTPRSTDSEISAWLADPPISPTPPPMRHCARSQSSRTAPPSDGRFGRSATEATLELGTSRPSPNHEHDFLELGVWCFSGAWFLVIS